MNISFKEILWAHLFHVIEFIGILGLKFLKMVRFEETKVNIQKWPSNNFPWKWKPSHVTQILGKSRSYLHLHVISFTPHCFNDSLLEPIWSWIHMYSIPYKQAGPIGLKPLSALDKWLRSWISCSFCLISSHIPLSITNYVILL